LKSRIAQNKEHHIILLMLHGFQEYLTDHSSFSNYSSVYNTLEQCHGHPCYVLRCRALSVSMAIICKRCLYLSYSMLSCNWKCS